MIELFLNLPIAQDSALKSFPKTVYHSPSTYHSKRIDKNISKIIIQTTHRNIAQNIQYYKNPKLHRSTHLSVSSDGKIVQHIPINRKSHIVQNSKEQWSDSFPNPGSITIDLTGYNLNNSLPKKQLDSAKELIDFLSKKYEIKIVFWKNSDNSFSSLHAARNQFNFKNPPYLHPYNSQPTLKDCCSELTKDPIFKNVKRKIYWYPSPSYLMRPQNKKIDTLYLYPTKKDLGNIIQESLNLNHKKSAHFTIAPSGAIIQHIKTQLGAFCIGLPADRFYHCKTRKNIDENAISIGVIKAEKEYTLAQIKSVRFLTNYLKAYYNIQQISTRLSAKPENKTYNNFPWAALHLPKKMITSKVSQKRISKDPLMKSYPERIYFMKAAGPGDATTFNYSPRYNSPNIDTIVLHHTACSFNGTMRIHMGPEYRVASHFTIDKDGLLVQHADLKYRCKHAGSFLRSKDRFGRTDVNNFSIGIELVNEGTGRHQYPTPQLNTLKKLLRHLTTTLPIRDITTHAKVCYPRGRKTDPLGFPWVKLKEFDTYLHY